MILRNAEARKAWSWAPFFSPDEFSCRHCGVLQIETELMDRLIVVRRALGRPMVINSGYRCPTYNKLVSKTGSNGPHTRGACDVGIVGEPALRLIAIAERCGMTGIGVNQKGNGRFIHLDSLPNGPDSPRPWVWSY